MLPGTSPGEGGLLEKLRSSTLISPVKMMVPSRYIPSIERAICADVSLEINATESDIKSHIEDRISNDDMLKRLITKPPSTGEKLVETVLEKARGMYPVSLFRLEVQSSWRLSWRSKHFSVPL